MRRIEFRWDRVGHRGSGALLIDVDGVSLAKLVADVEAPSAAAEGHPDLAGSYAGLTVWACPSDLERHFLGGDESHLHCGPHDKTVLMGCDCGAAGCWPLMATVSVQDDIVRWSSFEQPHRRGRWSYGDFALDFDRPQYCAALLSAQRRREQLDDRRE